MNTPGSVKNTRTISMAAARVAIAAAAAALVLLASLHVLSPEFGPSVRVVSQYANGHYWWVLSLMFATWGISSWALAAALWRQLQGIGATIPLGFLMVAGFGQAMAAVCDINHPLHNLAGALGVLGLPIAALLISRRLARDSTLQASTRVLPWEANLTWISVVLTFAGLFIMKRGYTLFGHQIIFIGWANLLIVVSHCVWTITLASQALRQNRQTPHSSVGQASGLPLDAK